jgi:hypothetical protein
MIDDYGIITLKKVKKNPAQMDRSGGDMMQHPSRFLAEIPRDLVNEWNLCLHDA